MLSVEIASEGPAEGTASYTIATDSGADVREDLARAVVNGDVTQIDLARGQKSGLIEARRILADVRGIAFTEFGAQDVVRHPLVARIIDAYEKHTEENPRAK